MKTLWILVVAFVLSSCVEDVYKGPKEETGKENTEYNDFDFSTVASDINLEVSYRNMGVEAAVYFELYDENPVEWTEYSYKKRTDIEPLYAAYTGEDGVFRGKVDLPSYMKKVYIYTPAFYAQTLIEADVVNGTIVASDDVSETRANGEDGRRTGGNGVCYMVEGQNHTNYQDARWMDWLGTYTPEGYVNYEYTGGDLSIENYAELYAVHASVIAEEQDCPEYLRSYSDMYVNEEAEVAVTFLGQNTCWNCSLGYYYYREGQAPSSLDEANVILLFPNTQDGQWGNDPALARKTRGIERGTTVQLKYYPNIAEGSDEGGTTVFPAGYRIGFVLANNAWSERVRGFTGDNLYRSATSEGLSVNNNGVPYGEPRTAVYKYGDVVMISFEDYKDDENFSDVVITMKTNPVNAITDIPEIDPDENTTTTNTLKGMYAFEDLWPDNGDYDMNDVLVRYHYGKTLNIYNEILAETFTFKTFSNYAGNNNGLAFTLPNGIPSDVKEMKYEIKLPGAEDFTQTAFTYEAETNTFLLTDNVKTNMGAEYRVTLNYASPILTESQAQVFIYKPGTGENRWEVHIACEAPTSMMDYSYFGTKDDCSNLDEGLYYVNNTRYPFAFFLAGATETDLSKLLISENESVPVSDLYPEYIGWSESNGTQNADWYK